MKPEVLFAVKSCNRDQADGFHAAIRETWGKGCFPPVNLKFFTGLGSQDYRDVVRLDVKDDYDSLPFKTKAILEWSVSHNYDFTFLCDTDTFTVPSRLMDSGFEKFDYSGRFGRVHPVGQTFKYSDHRQTLEQCHPWASGGVGYFVSRRAAHLITREVPDHWAEDLWVGQVLGPHVQSGYLKASDLLIECEASWHFPKRKYAGCKYALEYGWMETMYASHH